MTLPGHGPNKFEQWAIPIEIHTGLLTNLFGKIFYSSKIPSNHLEIKKQLNELTPWVPLGKLAVWNPLEKFVQYSVLSNFIINFQQKAWIIEVLRFQMERPKHIWGFEITVIRKLHTTVAHNCHGKLINKVTNNIY